MGGKKILNLNALVHFEVLKLLALINKVLICHNDVKWLSNLYFAIAFSLLFAHFYFAQCQHVQKKTFYISFFLNHI